MPSASAASPVPGVSGALASPASSVQLLRFAETEVPADLRAQVLALQEQAWPSEPLAPGEPEPDPAHDPALDPVSLLLVDTAGGRVLSALDLLTKEIEHAGEAWTATGLSRVVTDRAVGRRGHGSALVRAAHGMIAASGVDLGLFTCDRPLRGFYTGAGWQELEGSVLVGGTPESPFPSDQWDKVTLGGFFTARARAAADRFGHARIGLYPGPVDLLW